MTPATDQDVSNRPWIALTWPTPKASARYAGIVAKPPPYIVRMTQKIATKSARLPPAPAVGADAYSSMPSAKKIMYVVLRPMRSESDAQKMRPPMLKRLSRLVKPAAADAVTRPLKISWIIGEAIASTAIPAVTFMQSTPHRNQNCRVFQ